MSASAMMKHRAMAMATASKLRSQFMVAPQIYSMPAKRIQADRTAGLDGSADLWPIFIDFAGTIAHYGAAKRNASVVGTLSLHVVRVHQRQRNPL
jgi:hypothetical protein